MATKSKGQESTGEMFQVEDRPKKVGNFTGRKADAAKISHLTNIFTGFAQFAKSNPVEEGKQIVVTNVGAWTPQALAITGNKMLNDQRANGVDPGFYLVPTDRPELAETDEDGKHKYGAPTKLVIRVGNPPKRKKRTAQES